MSVESHGEKRGFPEDGGGYSRSRRRPLHDFVERSPAKNTILLWFHSIGHVNIARERLGVYYPTPRSHRVQVIRCILKPPNEVRLNVDSLSAENA